MKLHLHLKPEDELNGYTNICLSETSDWSKDLDDQVDDAEVTELIANNVLEFVPLTKLIDFLAQMIRKLRHDGTIIVAGVDAYTVAKQFANYKLSIEEFNVLLHGLQQTDNDVKLATLTLHGMVNFLKEEFGLTIIRKNLEDYNYFIEAKRP